MRRTLFIISALLLGFAVSCQKPDDGPAVVSEPPALVSSSPQNGATGVAGTSLDMVLTFDQNVMCPTSRQGDITIDNGASIIRVNAYMQEVTISIDGLEAGQTYTVVLPEGTVTGYRDNVAEEIRVAFSTKEPSLPVEQEIDKSLVTENPIPNAVRLYDYMRSIYGSQTLSGAMAKVNWNTDEAEWVGKWTDRYPAMAFFDYIHLASSPANWIDYSDIAPARNWFDAGGIIGAGWHWNVPKSENSTDLTFGVDGTFSAARAVIAGTWENEVVKADLDKIAGYLLLLQEEGIPVVWRPLHEAAGNTYTQYHSGAWFWWGADGAEAYVALWRYMFGYFNEKGLRNLIWVWTTQTSSEADSDYAYYPGDEYVDIVGRDIYNETDAEAIASQFTAITGMVTRKMVALSENGNVADMAAQWNAGAKWLFFMPWYDNDNNGSESFAHSHATISWWKSSFASETVVDRDSLPSLK